jgi:diaminopropionate ammonia-lyase
VAAVYQANPRHRAGRAKPVVNFTRAFHARLPGYAPTPLLDLTDLAADLGLRHLYIKDESARLGMPSFEVLGAAWALYRSLLTRLGRRPPRWETLDDLRPNFEPLRPVRVVAVGADGFGLGSARAASLLGCEARLYVSAAAAPERLELLRAHGAEVVEVGGSEDDALAAAAAGARPDDIVLSESSWEGFDEVPGWVTDGYVTVFEEIADELESRRHQPPDVIVVPMGTGALGAAAGWLRTEQFPPGLRLIGVEPVDAACFRESVVAGERRALPAPSPTVLGSLGRGLPSPLAYDRVSWMFDGFVSIGDDLALEAREILEAHGVVATPAGAASFGAVVAAQRSASTESGISADHAVLAVCSEGPIRPRGPDDPS